MTTYSQRNMTKHLFPPKKSHRSRNGVKHVCDTTSPDLLTRPSVGARTIGAPAKLTRNSSIPVFESSAAYGAPCRPDTYAPTCRRHRDGAGRRFSAGRPGADRRRRRPVAAESKTPALEWSPAEHRHLYKARRDTDSTRRRDRRIEMAAVKKDGYDRREPVVVRPRAVKSAKT